MPCNRVIERPVGVGIGGDERGGRGVLGFSAPEKEIGDKKIGAGSVHCRVLYLYNRRDEEIKKTQSASSTPTGLVVLKVLSYQLKLSLVMNTRVSWLCASKKPLYSC